MRRGPVVDRLYLADFIRVDKVGTSRDNDR